jgi:hypothetical protein
VVVELGTDEHAGHGKWRTQELVHRPHAFGDEQALTFSCFPPTQVASDR